MRLLIALALAASSASALAQSAVPTIDPDPIVVVGIRDGSTVGMVDYDKVWRRCAECKRALAKLTALSKPYHVKRGEIRRDAASSIAAASSDLRQGESAKSMTQSSGGIEKRAREMRAGRLIERMPDHQKKDMEELGAIRFDMTKLIASFLAQLEPHARAAAEEERAARQLAAVFDRNGKRPAAKVREVELTDAVIRRLDAKTFTIVLPDPPTLAKK